MSRHDHFPHAGAARAARRSAALDAGWRAADAPGLFAAIDAVADLSPAAALDRLIGWLDPAWLKDRIGAALALVAADPFARPPVALAGGGEGAGGLILARRGAVRLSLQLHPAGSPPAATALFVPGALALRVLAAGGASLRRHRVALPPAQCAGAFTAAAAAPCVSDPPRPLLPGELLRLDTAREAFTLRGATGDVLLLELAVQPPSPLPVRAHDIASGRLLHVSSSDRDASFRQMALALLRAMERRDAAPLFVAETHGADFAARWAAMRELVALDPAAAHPRLAAMAAADVHPELRAAAAATLALYPAPSAGGTGSEPRT